MVTPTEYDVQDTENLDLDSPGMDSPGTDEAPALRCTWHPDRETRLSCARCGRPICPECARRHPVGLRCPECARELRSPLYKVSPAQYVGGFLVGLVAGFLAGVGLGLVRGSWFLAIILSVPVGTVIGDAVGWGAGRKRGRGLQITGAVSMIIGTVLGLSAVSMRFGVGMPMLVFTTSLVGPIIFLLMGTGAAIRRLR
jgi:hypothetical protein